MARFRITRQHDSMQCGVACLSMICKYHGADIPLPNLERLCMPTREGVSFKSISDAAEDLGMECAAARVEPEQLDDLPLPCILHWNHNHFTVLYRVDRRKRRPYYVADPGKGLLRLTEEEFRSHWIEGDAERSDGSRPVGLALFMQPTDEFRKEKGARQSMKEPLRLVADYFRRYKKQILKIIAGLLVGSLCQLIFPFLTQQIVDRGIHDKDIGFIWLILLGELLIVAGATAADFFRRWIVLKVSMSVNISMVSDFFLKLMKLPMSYFDTKLLGDLLQRISDHGRVQDFLTSQTLSIIFSLLTLVVFGVVLCLYSPLIFGIYLVLSALYICWGVIFLSRRKVLDYEIFEQQARNSNKTYQLVTAMQEIKLQNCEQRRRREWEDVQMSLFGVRMKSLKLQQTQEAGSVFINELKNILMTVLAATAVIQGDMTLGGMLAIQYIIGQLNSPVEQLIGFLYTVQDVKLSLDRIGEIRNVEEEEEGRSSASEAGSTQDADGGIEFRDVSFRYDRHALRPTVSDISFAIPRGKVTAVVGASGSGKTTLLKLILGYYPVESGLLLTEGRDIASRSMREWRGRCGAVMQDGVIFSESIERNIAAGDGEPDLLRVHEAAAIAGIDGFIESLPLRYATVVGAEGIGLSQGQKQRILIARAVYRNPEFLLLDEATNSLDARNEREIAERLEKFFRGRTVLIIAHRLSTVKNADNIVVLSEGRIAEQGTHEELTRRRGAYYELVRNQLELGE